MVWNHCSMSNPIAGLDICRRVFLPNRFSLGSPAKEWFFAVPVLPFLLTVVCPNIMEFCVPCVVWYVGLSFCPFAPLSWEKWFSTQSWFMIAGLTIDPGNRLNFVWTKEMNPWIIDWMSNHNFWDMNSSPLVVSSFHVEKNRSAACSDCSRLSSTA